MAGKVNSVDDFLNHRGSTGGKSSFFKWREDGVGKTLVWLHTGALPQPVWIHPFVKVVVRENEKTRKQETRVWMERLVCHEDEDVLKDYKRDRDGETVSRLKHCAMCRFLAWLRTNVKAGKIDRLTPVFKFKSDVEKENKLFHAGGLCGLIDEDWIESLDEKGQKELRDAGISLRFVYSENALAKLNYIFLVVAESDTAAGVQTAIEAELLGDKVKTVIHNARKSKGSEAGDPFKNPYAIEWQANGKARKISDKYDACMIESVKLSPVVKRLITGAIPSTKHLTKPFDPDTTRAFLERHCLLKGVPWDDIFKVEVRGAADEEESDPDLDFPPPDESGVGVTGAADSTEVEAAEPNEDELYKCNVCEKGSVDPLLCTHCGAKYSEDGTLVFDPRKKEEPKMRTRGRGPAAKPADTSPPPAKVDYKPNPKGEAGDADDKLPWG